MTNVSLAGSGILALVVAEVLRWGGIDNIGDPASAFDGLLTFIGWVALIYGQLRRKDLTIGFFRK